MGFKTTSTRFTQAKSAQSSDLVAYNNATSGGPSISGTSLTPASAITTVTATPGQSAASGTTSSGVLISTVVYTDSGYNTLSANAASTTFGYVRILGSGFVANANVFISNTGVSLSNVTTNTTFVSSGEIRANVPSTTAGNYTLYVFNPSGSAAIYYSGIAFEPYPLWNTTSVTFGGTTISGNVATYVTSTAGIQPITFSLAAGNTLPSGLTLYSNGAILGTITQSNSTQTYYANIVATDLYNEATTSNISLTVNLTDPSFNSTTLLLNGETNTGTNYIADASTNNFALTVSGAANPNRFSPLWGAGYYGNSFDGSTGYLSVPGNAYVFGTNSFTVEFWAYPTSATEFAGGAVLIDNFVTASYTVGQWQIEYTSTGGVYFSVATSSSVAQTISGGSSSINTWTHFAVVRNGTTVTIYINGVSVATGTYSQSIGANAASSIGRQTSTNSYFYQGYISNVRMVNGTAVYTSAFTPPTTPLTAITNTALLTCQSANFVDNSTNAFTLTPTGTVKVVSNQPFGALPSSVQNYGSSLFDGSTGYLSAPSGAGALGTNPFTIEFWYYGIANGNAYATVVSKNVTGSPSSGTWGFGINFNGTPSVWFSYYTTGFVDVQTSQAVSNQQWHHIAATRNGTVLNLYLDGVLTQTATLPSNFSFGPSSDPTLIGYNSRNNAYINGYISNLRIFNNTAVYTANFTPPTVPFTPAINTALLTLQNKNGINNNVFYDDSVNNFAITRTGTPTQGTFTPFSQTGWSNYFGAAANYMSISSVTAAGTGDFTYECWTYLTSYNATYGNIIVDHRSGSTHTAGIFFYITLSGYLSIYLGPTDSTTAVPLNQWVHIAVVRSSGSVTYYINGTNAGGGGSFTRNCTQTPFYISAANDNPGLYYSTNGYYSNLRYSRSAVYTSTFVPSTTPLTTTSQGATNCTVLTCQSSRFLDNSTNNFALTSTGTPQVQAFSPFAPGVAYSPTTNGGSLYLNGSTDYLNTASVSPLQFGTNSFTIELWIYPLAGSLTANLFDFRTSAVNGLYPTLLLNAGALNYYTNSATQITGGAPAPYAWSHVALVRNSTSTILYLNGVQTGSTYADSNSYLDGTSAPVIGGSGFSRGSSYFNGYISNLRIVNGTVVYTSAFTPPTAPLTPTANTSLLLLGSNTGIQDATGKNDIIGSAKTQANTVKYGTGAMYFDGSTGYLQNLSAINKQLFTFGSGNFTVELWVYPLSQGGHGSSNNDCLIDFRNYSSGGACGVLYIYTNGTSVNWFVNGAIAISGSSISNNTWNHIAVSRSGTSTKLFINGTQAGSTFSDSTVYVASPITIGQFYDGTGGGYFNGYIDDLRITNGVARYTANFTPPASAFLTL